MTRDLAEELDAANARIAELEKQRPAPPAQSARLEADLAAGQDVAADWLNGGCPICHLHFAVDGPVFEPGQSGLYPAVLYHYGVFHEGVTPPPPPHPNDETALEVLVARGIQPNGHARQITYREAIVEAIAEATRGGR